MNVLDEFELKVLQEVRGTSFPPYVDHNLTVAQLPKSWPILIPETLKL